MARGARRREVPLALGGVATALMGIVGCTTVTGGKGHPTGGRPRLPASVSASVSASSATSSVRESQRQQSLTTQAVHTACESMLPPARTPSTRSMTFVAAFNAGRNTTATEGPAVDALNHSADPVAADSATRCPRDYRTPFNAYVDAAHGVANAIGSHRAPATSDSTTGRSAQRHQDQSAEALHRRFEAVRSRASLTRCGPAIRAVRR